MGPPRPVLPFGPTNVHSRRRARRVRVGRPVMAQRHGPIWRETRTRGRLPSCLHHPPSASSARSAERRRRRRRRRLPPSDWNKHVPASGPAQARFALPSECADCVPTASSLHRAESTRDGTRMFISAAQGGKVQHTLHTMAPAASLLHFSPFLRWAEAGAARGVRSRTRTCAQGNQGAPPPTVRARRQPGQVPVRSRPFPGRPGRSGRGRRRAGPPGAGEPLEERGVVEEGPGRYPPVYVHNYIYK